MSDSNTALDAVAATAAKVREFLSPFEDVDLHDDGSCSLKSGSARVHVTVGVFDEDESIVQVKARVITGATLSPALYEHVATHQAEVGHLSVTADSDGTGTIWFSHGLLGEFLNPAELRMTVIAVAFGADAMDEALATSFGGQVSEVDGAS